MKLYTYISKAKIDMLYDQIDPGHADRDRQKTTKFGVGFQGTGVERTTTEKAIRSLHRKLESIIRQLRKAKQIGDIESISAPYVEGQFDVRCGSFGWHMKNDSLRLIMWIGNWLEDSVHKRIALGGSAHHLTGNLQRDSLPHVHSSSATESIEQALRHEQVQDDSEDWDFLRGLALASHRLDRAKAPIQRIETIFCVLGTWHSKNVDKKKPEYNFTEQDMFFLIPGSSEMLLVLGSPLYVELAS